jgi:predicted permease
MISGWRDVKLAWRSLLAGGATTFVAFATLALGIGLSATTFSVLDSILWRQVPFANADRLVEVASVQLAGKITYKGMPKPVLQEWRRQTDLFASVEAYERTSLVFETGAGAEMVPGTTVTPGLIAMLGVGPARGRLFAADDGQAGGDAAVIVSDAFWRGRLQRAPDVLSRSVRLNGRDYRIKGVMPAAFRFPSGIEEVWIASSLEQPPAGVPLPRAWTPVARLRQGLTLESATAAVQGRGEHVITAAGGPPDTSATLDTPGRLADARTERSLWVLSGAVAFLFLIVCANVANLTLSRATYRLRDFATYAALGATPRQIIRSAFVEQLLLAAAGAAGAVVIAVAATRVTVAVLPDAMTAGTLNAIDLDGRALAFMLLTGVVATLFFGLPPALAAGKASVTRVLAGGGRAATGPRGAATLRTALVVLEVAISVVLIVGAALMTRSFMKLAAVDTGFDTRNLISLRLGLPSAGYADLAVRDRVSEDIVA